MSIEKGGSFDIWPTISSIEQLEAVGVKRNKRDLKVQTNSPLTFQFLLPSVIPKVCLKDRVSPTLIRSVDETVSRLSDERFLSHCPSSPHSQSLGFIIANWGFILEELGQRVNQAAPIFCYPEVKFGIAKYHDADIIGYGGNGTILIVEVGVKSRKKRTQLARNIENFKRFFPTIDYLGLLCRYSCEDPGTIKLAIDFLNC